MNGEGARSDEPQKKDESDWIVLDRILFRSRALERNLKSAHSQIIVLVGSRAWPVRL